MYEDPIVAEVRQAGEALAEQAGGDLHTFFQFLREVQQQYRNRLVQGPMDAIMRESSFAHIKQVVTQESIQESIQEVLEVRFTPNAANQFAADIRAIGDLQRLKQLHRVAVQVDNLDEFQRELDAEERRDFPKSDKRDIYDRGS